ncbi:hypothetical protein [Halomonas sp. E19]|uniref:hypothetical protein n=1 Tax=Halomonas sp. E19 TaxID=3397247 RepID=UPI004034B3C7
MAQVDEHAVALGGVAFSAGRLAVDAGAGNARKRYQGGTRAEASELAEKERRRWSMAPPVAWVSRGIAPRRDKRVTPESLPATKVEGLDMHQDMHQEIISMLLMLA